MRQLFYYIMRQKFITKCVRFFITKCDSFIQNAAVFLQNVAVITKCDNFITKCDITCLVFNPLVMSLKYVLKRYAISSALQKLPFRSPPV